MEEIDPGVIMIIGLAIAGGLLSAGLFQRLHVPQVVGYIVIGLAIGASGLGIITTEDVQQLQPVSLFALSIIGFLVGGELQRETFRTYGKQFAAILLGEGLGAFFLTGIGVFALVYAVSGNLLVSVSAGLVFGAIASATDPASTLDVLWEYRSRGVVTTTIIAIVALDDALALTLYGLGTSIAQMLSGQEVAFGNEALIILRELGGAVALGAAAGVAMAFMLRWLHQPERRMAMIIGILLMVLGLSAAVGMDVILAAMSLGVVLINMEPKRSKELFTTVRAFATPIYVLFFVLVGARLSIGSMPVWLWGLVILYVITRGLGKIARAYAGARLTHAAPAVRKYVGLGLFPQAGIAVGLSIMAAERLEGVPLTADLSLSEAIIFSIAATTLIIQLTGPQLVKLVSRWSDEMGRNVTEEDVVASLHVEDVMDRGLKAVNEYEPLTRVISTLSHQEYLALPVVNRENELVGVVSLEGLKEVLAEQDTWEWLVARDAMSSLKETSLGTDPLKSALYIMQDTGLDHLFVVDKATTPHLAGAIDMRRVRKRIKEEVLKRQSVA